MLLFEKQKKLRDAWTYSGLDSGVKLDMSSDVGTKKRKIHRQREGEWRGKGKGQ